MRRIIWTSLALMLLAGLVLPLGACREERDIPPPPYADSQAEEDEAPQPSGRSTGDLRESGNATIGKAKQSAERTIDDLERRSREIAEDDDE